MESPTKLSALDGVSTVKYEENRFLLHDELVIIFSGQIQGAPVSYSLSWSSTRLHKRLHNVTN